MILRELLRYGAKGGVATLANVALMSGLVELGGLQPRVAALLSTSVLLLIGYVVMNRFVFRERASPDGAVEHLRRGVAYYAVILSGKGINYALFVGLTAAGVWYPAAWIIGAVTVFVGTFSANRVLWTRGEPA